MSLLSSDLIDVANSQSIGATIGHHKMNCTFHLVWHAFIANQARFAFFAMSYCPEDSYVSCTSLQDP